MIEQLKRIYSEPILNSNFLSPYLKIGNSSQGIYDLLFLLIPMVPEQYHSDMLGSMIHGPGHKGVKRHFGHDLGSGLLSGIIVGIEDKIGERVEQGQYLNKALALTFVLS